MPSFTSIINTLLRVLPNDRVADLSKSVLKLHPTSETLSDPIVATIELTRLARAWHTRHAYETLRGWKWPFWMHAQMSPLSPAYISMQADQFTTNRSSRDAVAVPGLPGTYAGSLDRRGMFTGRNGQFSIEVWFCVGGKITFLSEILNESSFAYTGSLHGVKISADGREGRFQVQASAHALDSFQYVKLQAAVELSDEAQGASMSVYYSVRPYNLESTVPLHDLVYNSRGFWMSDSRIIAWSPSKPGAAWASDARHGDAAFFIMDPPERSAVRCPAGMVTAVMEVPLNGSNEAVLILPLEATVTRSFPFVEIASYLRQSGQENTGKTYSSGVLSSGTGWLSQALEFGIGQLHAVTDVTHPAVRDGLHVRNHWLSSVVRSFLYQGETSRAAALLRFVFLSQQKNGYLVVGGNQWAFQGQALAGLAEYYRLSREVVDDSIATYSQIRAAARWIIRKRREITHAPSKPRGLLPPGVCRSGVGSEYNLVDNLWCLEGLSGAAWLARQHHEHTDAEILQRDIIRFSSRISEAVHRELEYALKQLVPGRLHRAFDASSAAELLDLAMMPEATRLLKSNEWFGKLVDALIEPLDDTTSNTVNQVILRQMDERGVMPGRRMMLCLAMLVLKHPELPTLVSELGHLRSSAGGWAEIINLDSGLGAGAEMIDIEATALLPVLIRMILVEDNQHQLIITEPAAELVSWLDQASIRNSPTENGPISLTFTGSLNKCSIILDSGHVGNDVEVHLKKYGQNDYALIGYGSAASGSYSFS